ncbi:WS/DGAT domain-containing protein [Corynebacteriales bacterium D3-21]|uniref:diacylglycerol O-acyltransferase n=2 Tax=Speluncibacter jeojiensis TaxID=2710754 RepID=A0A9X4M1U5_9ACTN|nr:WS/DGAT domain-containing protein [Corynebacteriales bacterium D3-21]
MSRARTARRSGRLRPTDAAHVYVERLPDFPNVVDVWVFDTSDDSARPIDAAAASEWLRARVAGDPTFRRCLVRVPLDLDYPLWVDDPDFSIENHVSSAVATEAGWAPVEQAIAATLETPVDLSRPPWRLHLLTDVNGVAEFPASATVAVLTFHHCAGDGVRTVELAEKLFAGTATAPTPTDAASSDRSFEGLSPSRASLAATAMWRLPVSLGILMRGLGKGVLASRSVALAGRRGELPAPVGPWPVTMFNTTYSGQAGVRTVSFDLGEVRRVKAVVAGATINDVAMTVTSLAMSSYLDGRAQRPDGSLGAVVPMSWRKSDRDLATANQFCLMSVDLHTEAVCPLERLRSISATAKQEKQRQRHRAMIRLGDVADSVPAVLLRVLARRRRPASGDTLPLGNVMISNVPRSNSDLQLLDAPVAAGFGVLAIGTGEVLSHFVSSLGERLTVAVVADRRVVPDIDRYAELLEKSFAELCGALA